MVKNTAKCKKCCILFDFNDFPIIVELNANAQFLLVIFYVNTLSSIILRSVNVDNYFSAYINRIIDLCDKTARKSYQFSQINDSTMITTVFRMDMPSNNPKSG